MNKARLLKLANFLIALPPQKFNYGLVAVVGEKPMLEALKAKKESCGTAACAMGWTPAIFPKLVEWDREQREGLQMDVCSRVTGAERDAAMMELFDITRAQVDFLFYPDTNGNRVDQFASAKVVGRHIIRFVKWNEKRLATLKKVNRRLARLQTQVEKLESTIGSMESYDGQYPDRG